MKSGQTNWFRFQLATLILAMTAACLISWAYIHRSYETNELVLQRKPPAAQQSLDPIEVAPLTLQRLDWWQLYGDTTWMFIVIVSLAIVIAWINLRSKDS